MSCCSRGYISIKRTIYTSTLKRRADRCLWDRSLCRTVQEVKAHLAQGEVWERVLKTSLKDKKAFDAGKSSPQSLWKSFSGLEETKTISRA